MSDDASISHCRAVPLFNAKSQGLFLTVLAADVAIICQRRLLSTCMNASHCRQGYLN